MCGCGVMTLCCCGEDVRDRDWNGDPGDAETHFVASTPRIVPAVPAAVPVAEPPTCSLMQKIMIRK